MNSQEILTLAEAIVGAWDWATEVSHPRPNQIDVKVTHLNELVPIVVGLRVKRLGYLCAIVGLTWDRKLTRWKCSTTSAPAM